MICSFTYKAVSTVNRNGTSWLFIRINGGLLLLVGLPLGRLVGAIAVEGHQIQNDAVVDHAIDGRHGAHRILENALPFTEDEICTDQHRFAFIALGQKDKEHLYFVAILVGKESASGLTQ